MNAPKSGGGHWGGRAEGWRSVSQTNAVPEATGCVRSIPLYKVLLDGRAKPLRSLAQALPALAVPTLEGAVYKQSLNQAVAVTGRTPWSPFAGRRDQQADLGPFSK